MSYYGNLYQNEELSHRAKTVYNTEHPRLQVSIMPSKNTCSILDNRVY